MPAVIQDADSKAVLMLGYMNKESFAKTLKTKKVWFYSRSKKRLWMKGEKSGNVLNFVGVKVDCDGDSLLVQATPTGPVCHTGNETCFEKTQPQKDLQSLFARIQNRKREMPKGSYTASLFKAGLNKITLKVAEESMEVVQAAQKETKQRLKEEATDLIYHLFALLVERGITLQDIDAEIRKRNEKKRGK